MGFRETVFVLFYFIVCIVGKHKGIHLIFFFFFKLHILSPVVVHGLLIVVTSLVTEHGLSGPQASAVVAHRLGCPKARGIVPD